MAILSVGAGQQFVTIGAAVAAAQAGDTVQVQAGTYVNDFARVAAAITIEAVGGVAHLVATVAPPDGKAIMTVDASATIKGLDFSGAKVPDANGAGIRYEAGNLTLIGCSFHDNENGLMSAAIPGGILTVTGCTFDHNGNGNGYTHNIYIGDIASAVITDSTFTNAVVGHEIKSRAESTTITGCTISDGPTGTASYSIDLPNGGVAVVKDNTIEKGPNAENGTVIHFGGEGFPYPGSKLTVSDNTITNDMSAHPVTAVTNATLASITVTGNTFKGIALANIAVGPAALTSNTGPNGAKLPDSSVVDLAGGGATTYFTDAADHTVSLDVAYKAVVGGAGRLTATGYSHETVVGGAGGLIYTGQGGADNVVTAAGGSNVVRLGAAGNAVYSSGTDLITGSTGNDGIVVNGTATVSGSTGNTSYAINGTAVVTGHGGGLQSYTIGADAHATITEGANVALYSNGGTFSLARTMTGATVADTATVTGGAVSLRAYDSSGLNMTVSGGSKGMEIDCGTGNHTIIDGGNDTIRAGSGNELIILSGSAEVWAGSGAMRVFGRGITGQATVHGGAGTTLIDGDTGNIRFLAEGGPAIVQDNLSHVQIVGGASLLTVNANAYCLTVQGGAGGMVFNDTLSGHDITTASGSSNVLNLYGGSTVHSNGADLITCGTPSGYSITATGQATVQGAGGNNYYSMGGASSLVTRSACIDRTTVTAGANVQLDSFAVRDSVTISDAQLHYTADGSTRSDGIRTDVTITGTAWLDRSVSNTVQIGSTAGTATRIDTTGLASIYSQGADTISAGACATNLTLSGTATVLLSSGASHVVNTGSATVQGGAGATSVDMRSGALTFVGSSGDTNIAASGGALSVNAGAGNTTLVGGGGALSFQAGAGAAQLKLGAGNSTVEAGSGALTLACGAGRELIEIAAGTSHGPVVVTGFDAGSDQLRLAGYAPGSSQAAATSGGMQLTLSDGTQVLFAGLLKLPVF